MGGFNTKILSFVKKCDKLGFYKLADNTFKKYILAQNYGQLRYMHLYDSAVKKLESCGIKPSQAQIIYLKMYKVFPGDVKKSMEYFVAMVDLYFASYSPQRNKTPSYKENIEQNIDGEYNSMHNVQIYKYLFGDGKKFPSLSDKNPDMSISSFFDDTEDLLRPKADNFNIGNLNLTGSSDFKCDEDEFNYCDMKGSTGTLIKDVINSLIISKKILNYNIFLDNNMQFSSVTEKTPVLIASKSKVQNPTGSKNVMKVIDADCLCKQFIKNKEDINKTLDNIINYTNESYTHGLEAEVVVK